MSDNLALWKRREKTDPNYTKHVGKRGGFTAIDAQWQTQQATEEWGPYGQGWGLTDLRWDYIRDAEFGEPLEICLEAIFYYGRDYKKGEQGRDTDGAFPISSDMPYKPGDECRKKLMTDCQSKALSKLGFSADVFMGRFDDNRYVEQRKAEVAAEMEKIERTDPQTGELKIGKEQRKAIIAASKARAGDFHERDIDMPDHAAASAVAKSHGFTSLKDVPDAAFAKILEEIQKWEP